jgi:hypothetical protein
MNGPDVAAAGPSPFEGRASRGRLRVTEMEHVKTIQAEASTL